MKIDFSFHPACICQLVFDGPVTERTCNELHESIKIVNVGMSMQTRIKVMVVLYAVVVRHSLIKCDCACTGYRSCPISTLR